MKKKTPREKYDTCLLVLDANVLIRDFWWEGTAFAYLKNRLFLGHTLMIPDIAVREAVNSMETRASELLERIGSAEPTPRLLAQYQRLFNKVTMDFESPADLGSRYRAFIESEISKSNGFIGEIPQVSLSEIVDRSITRKKPFSKGDKGFRDTLIWLCTVDLVKTYTRVSFISQNTNDFSGEGSLLHPDLSEEVERVLPSGMRFNYFKSLDEFIAVFDSHGTASACAFRNAILTSGYKGFSLDRWFRRNLTKLSRSCELDGIRWAGMPYWAEDPRMIKLIRLVGLSVDEEIEVDGNCVIFNVDLAAIALFQCSILYANWESVIHSSQVRWHDEESEDAWTEVGLESVATYTCRLRFDLDEGKVTKSWLTPLEHEFSQARVSIGEHIEFEKTAAM